MVEDVHRLDVDVGRRKLFDWNCRNRKLGGEIGEGRWRCMKYSNPMDGEYSPKESEQLLEEDDVVHCIGRKLKVVTICFFGISLFL